MVEDFDDLERELRDHLQPRPAPPAFAAHVAARLAAEQQPRSRFARLAFSRPDSAGTDRLQPSASSRHPIWQWATVAAALIAMLLGGVEHQRQQRIAGEHARAQVMLALRITAATLHDVNQKINQPAQTGHASTPAENQRTAPAPERTPP